MIFVKYVRNSKNNKINALMFLADFCSGDRYIYGRTKVSYGKMVGKVCVATACMCLHLSLTNSAHVTCCWLLAVHRVSARGRENVFTIALAYHIAPPPRVFGAT